MNEEEYYKLRAEDFSANFHSLRPVEWQVAFQTYAGYAAIVIGYLSLSSEEQKNILIVRAIIMVSVFIFLIGLYTSLRILERMQNTRNMQNFCLKRIEEILKNNRKNVSIPFPLTPKTGFKFWFKVHQSPIHGKWYAFTVQTLVSVLWLIGVIFFTVRKTL